MFGQNHLVLSGESARLGRRRHRRWIGLGLAVALACGLSLAGSKTAWASNPSISGPSNPVQIPAGQASAQAILTWDLGSGSPAEEIWVQRGTGAATFVWKGGGDQGFLASETHSSEEDIFPGDNIFTLWNQGKTQQLASVDVIGQQASGPSSSLTATSAGASISANPNPVTIPDGEVSAVTTITWDPAGGSPWQVSETAAGGFPQTIASSGFLASTHVPATVAPGDNVFTLSSGNTQLASLHVTARYANGSTQAPFIHSSDQSVTIPSGQPSAPTTLTWGSGGGSAGQIWAVRPGASGAPDNSVQILDDSDGSKSALQANVFPGDNTFQLWDAGKQVLLASVHVQGSTGQGGSGPSAASATGAQPLVLSPSATWYSDYNQAQTNPDSYCNYTTGEDYDPDPNVSATAILVGYNHYDDPASGPFPCWTTVQNFARGAVEFDWKQVNGYVKAHGMTSATLGYSIGAGDGGQCVASIQTNSTDTSTSAPFLYGYPIQTYILPGGPSLDSAPVAGYVLPGGVAEGSEKVDVSGLLLKAEAAGGVDPHLHFVFVGQDETQQPGDQNNWDNNHCWTELDTFTLTVVADH